VVKRTEIVDKHGQQWLEDGLCKYIYHIIVTNDFDTGDTRVMHIALARANQENLIKDFKYGLGLSHVPTGFFLANQIYFKISRACVEHQDLDVESAFDWRWRGVAVQTIFVPVDKPCLHRVEDRT
jgi:hypothetical protein